MCEYRWTRGHQYGTRFLRLLLESLQPNALSAKAGLQNRDALVPILNSEAKA